MYGENELAIVLAYMCLNSSTVHATTKRLRDDKTYEHSIPTAPWVSGMLRAPSYRKMEARCKNMNARIVRECIRDGMLPRNSFVAIDGHDIPYTGDREAAGSNITSGKPKGGTSKFVEFITAQAVSETQLPSLAVEQRTERHGLGPCLRGIFSTVDSFGMRPVSYLFDRGFFGIDTMKILDECGITFLMAARKTKGIMAAVEEVKRGERAEVSEYTMKSDRGEFTFYLVVRKRMRTKGGKRFWEHLVFATNVPPHRIDAVLKDVPETYKQRWRIENGYKSIEQIRPPTHSRSPAVRLLMFYMGVIGCNLWYMANAAARARAAGAGVSRRRVRRIHLFLEEFMCMLAKVADEVNAMSSKDARDYLDAG